MKDYSDKMTGRYIESVGRRKTATARVRMFANDQEIAVNSEPMPAYFPKPHLQEKVTAPFTIARDNDQSDEFFVSVHVSGSGKNGQAEAIRHGIARALVDHDTSLKKPLKDAGFLKRDPRMVERKKPGKKKARKSSQWSKR